MLSPETTLRSVSPKSDPPELCHGGPRPGAGSAELRAH